MIPFPTRGLPPPIPGVSPGTGRRALEIMRTTGTSGLALPAIVAEHVKAAAAIQRIQNLHGIKA
jgi:hypothetical protein